MFSRRLLCSMMSAVLLVTSTGCGLNTGENPPPVQTPSFSGNGYSCVGEIPTQVDLYFNDKLSETQISDFMRCLQKSFVGFAQLTRGRNQDEYSPNEIRNFLQEHFFKERKITDEFLRELMIIKQSMIGGSLNSITRQELSSTVEFLDDIRKEAIRLKPHLQVLNPRLADLQKPRDLGERLADANNALRGTIQTFVVRLQRSRQTYAYSSLTKFLTEFRDFVEWDKYYTAQDSRPVDRWVTMLKEFKEVTVSEVEPNGVRTTEWTPLLENMSRWYLAYLQYRVGVQKQPILEGVGLQNTIFLADELFHLAGDAVRSHSSRTIPYAKVSELYQAVYNLGWVKTEIHPEGLQRALEAAFTKVFGDSRSSTYNRRVLGLKEQTLDAMRMEFNRWADVQLRIDRNYGGKTDTGTVPSIQSVVPNAANVLARLADNEDSDYNEFLKVSTQNLIRPLYTEHWKPKDPFTISIVPGTRRDFSAAGLSLREPGIADEFYNLSRTNLLRAIVTLVFRGYAGKGNREADWNSVLTKPELELFYQEFRSLGIDLGFVDPRNERVGERAFTEANLFTYSSDNFHQTEIPSGQLRFTEGVELAAFMYSGSEVATRLYSDLRAKCVPEKISDQWPLDFQGQPKIPRCCVYRELPDELVRVLTNMPGLQTFLIASTPAERVRRTEYIEKVLNAVYSRKNSVPAFVEMSEFTTLAVVLHYAEAVMTRFDANRDGLLTTSEIVDEKNGILPIFTGHLMTAINDMRTRETEKKNRATKGHEKPALISESDARAVFLFMLQDKRAPDPSAWGDWFSLVWLSRGGSVPDLSLSRYDLASIFEVFGSLLTNSGDDVMKQQAGPNLPLPVNSCQQK